MKQPSNTVHSTGHIVASYDPNTHEYYQNKVMYHVDRKWVLHEKWRMGNDNNNGHKES